MNHLMRELAPVTDIAWEQIEEEATRSIKHFVAARRLVDFGGPHGWTHSAVDTGRVGRLESSPHGDVEASARVVIPLVELRSPFVVDRTELATADRGARDVDLEPVSDAAKTAALAEDHLVFHGLAEAGVAGLVPSSPHPEIAIGDDYGRYPEHVAAAVSALRAANVGGPYAIALGSRCFTGVAETTEHGGYPVFEHIRHILGGPIVWAPAVEGAVVMSQRGGDFELTVGQDFSIGYRSSDAESVQLYVEESLAFRITTPEAAVHLAYP
ncbi:MAG: family 1 encapsulin nanocompartment shell protein [Acidimicrobiales bacterium]